MSNISAALAKLSGIQKSLKSVLEQKMGHNGIKRSNFSPKDVEHYFKQASVLVAELKEYLPDLYGDFQEVEIKAETKMSGHSGEEVENHFSRNQVERLSRDIDQIFEIRANCELEQPIKRLTPKVFISHGKTKDWKDVQLYIEKDLNIETLELAQQPNEGKTIFEKLMDSSSGCNSAVIVMTGDDMVNENEVRARENVMHEIGYFQGCYGRSKVVLLHEEGVNIPSNLAGVAYVPFPKNSIEATFHVLHRELKSIYKI